VRPQTAYLQVESKTGSRVREVARRFGLDAGLVSRWVATQTETNAAAAWQAVATDQRERERLAELTALIADHLRETLRAMGTK
jgi:transposase-like protein